MKHFYALLVLLFIGSPALCQDAESPVVQSAALQVQPEYPGGINEFYKFVSKNYRTPDLETSMTAKILMSFVVEKDGTLSNIAIVKDPGYGMGAEAERVLRLCTTKWKPGMQEGKPVRASFMLPLSIVIDAGDTEEEPKE